MNNLQDLKKQGLWPLKKIPDNYIRGLDHWYTKENIDRINESLDYVFSLSPGNKFLDISFGNPILLKRAMLFSEDCRAHYIHKQNAINDSEINSTITEGDYDEIPYSSESFDIITSYAFLHIIPDLRTYVEETYRLLKPGGCLYTDGDRNITLIKFMRFINLFTYKIFLPSNKSKINYWKNLLNENTNFHSQGIDHFQLRKLMYEIGFQKVTVLPWFTLNHKFSNNIIFKLFVFISKVLYLDRFLFTHVKIVAKK